MKSYERIWIAAMLLAIAATGARADDDNTVKALKKLGAGIRRDETRPGNPVIEVGLRCGPEPDDGLVHLVKLKELRSLGVSCAVTDGGLALIGGLKELQRLRINAANRLTDAGLVHLAKLKKLQLLEVSTCPVTGVGFKD